MVVALYKFHRILFGIIFSRTNLLFNFCILVQCNKIFCSQKSSHPCFDRLLKTQFRSLVVYSRIIISRHCCFEIICFRCQEVRAVWKINNFITSTVLPTVVCCIAIILWCDIVVCPAGRRLIVACHLLL